MIEMKNNTHSSIWSSSCGLPEFPDLKKDIKTGVLIIGGGIAGILCGFMLEQAGVDYILLEADRICSGITKNTTAKITSQHGLIYDKLLKRFGEERAFLYLEANQRALEKYRELSEGIDCNFEEKDAFVYSLDRPEILEKELDALHRLHFPAELREKLPLPFPAAGAVRFPDQAQFHPLKFLAAIVKNMNIYEHTKVKELIVDRRQAVTEACRVTAGKIIVATHFPFLNQHGSYFLKMFQHRSYVIALEQAKCIDGMLIEDKKTGMSFRSFEDLLLIGGGGHRTGKQGGNWKELRKFAAQYYPQAKERYRWAAQDCMTLDQIPYIGQYSKNLPGFYVITGFHKWGMTSAMAGAMLLTDLVMGKENPYAAVFSPSRSILRPQLICNAAESLCSLLTISKPRCPHLGCALKWNKAERSWDCSCHGSRFTEQGELLDNPATDDLNKANNRNIIK